MKKNISFIFILYIILFVSCYKSNINTSYSPLHKNYAITNFAEALPIYDSSNYGIYKGVVIDTRDSLATFKINIDNSTNHPYSLFYSNYQVTDSLIRYLPNFSNLNFRQVPDTHSIVFNTSFYSNFSSYHVGYGPLVGFSVEANGLSPIVNLTSPGYYALNAVLKERSSNQVFCFEGSYSGLDSGKIAFVISSDEAAEIGVSNISGQFFKGTTTVNVLNGTFVINANDPSPGIGAVVFTGSILNNICSGTWTINSNPGIINQFLAKRTL